MKDKKIRIAIGRILVMGTGVTHYTKYYMNNQGVVVMARISIGTEKMVASSFAPTLGQLDTEADGADVGMVAGRAASTTPAERKMMEDAGPGNAAPGNTASEDAGSESVGPGNAVYAAALATEAAGALSSDHATSVMVDAAEKTMVSDTAGSASAVEGAAVSETVLEKDIPISPLTGARIREYKASCTVDYHERLEDSDTRILKMREEETDSNVYSIKASAGAELKLWKGKLNSVYNALMEMLFREDGARLAPE